MIKSEKHHNAGPDEKLALKKRRNLQIQCYALTKFERKTIFMYS